MKNELFCMYKYSSMIKTAAFCAASFALVSVLFKNSIVLIPEVTEVRLCNVLACSFGIWFGPAGAWGCALGNLIGDLGGSLTVLSFPGFAANFLSAWMPYKIWNITGALLDEQPLSRPSLKSKHWLIRYLLGGIVSVSSCAAVLGFSFDFTKSMPAANTFSLILLNNSGATVLGLFLFIIMCSFRKTPIRYWREQMYEESDYSFTKESKNKMFFILALAVALIAFMLTYNSMKGFTLSTMDKYGNRFTISILIIYSLVNFAVTYSCNMKKTERSEGIMEL